MALPITIPGRSMHVRTGIRAGVELPEADAPFAPVGTGVFVESLGLSDADSERAQRFLDLGGRILASAVKSHARRAAARTLLLCIAASMGLPAALTALCLMRLYQGYELGRDLMSLADSVQKHLDSDRK